MNYLKEINVFTEYKNVNRISAGQSSLWYTLMAINNKSGWKEWFTATNKYLEIQSGLSQKGIYNARNVLKEKGLIDFKCNGQDATKYRMKSCILFGNTTTDTIIGTTTDTTEDFATLNKQYKTKQNKTYYNNHKNKFNNCDITEEEKEYYKKLEDEILEKMLLED